MAAPGLRLTVLTGRSNLPLEASLTARLISVTVTEADDQQSVFTLVLDAGRSRHDLLDVPGLTSTSLRPSSRLVLELGFGARPVVLVSGVVTRVELAPGDGPGRSSLQVSGEDLSYLLDRVATRTPHPQSSDRQMAEQILAPWATEGVIGDVHEPVTSVQPSEQERVPSLEGSDLAKLRTLAGRNKFVTYMTPGPGRANSTLYWGSPIREGRPQPPLSVDLGPESTLTGVRFVTDAFAPVTIEGTVFDRGSCSPRRITADHSSLPALSARPLQTAFPEGIRRRFPADPVSDATAAAERAGSEVDRAGDAVTAHGSVDGARYGDVLRPRGLVSVRGAGDSHDGTWYVQRVVHSLARGHYRQDVDLSRAGHGSTVPRVPSGALF